MKFVETPLAGLWVIEPTVFADGRGFFMETYHKEKFAAHGIREEFVQQNHSRSKRGVIRGLHYQKPPFEQGKLVRVVAGEVFDVAVDIRPGSPNSSIPAPASTPRPTRPASCGTTRPWASRGLRSRRRRSRTKTSGFPVLSSMSLRTKRNRRESGIRFATAAKTLQMNFWRWHDLTDAFPSLPQWRTRAKRSNLSDPDCFVGNASSMTMEDDVCQDAGVSVNQAILRW